MNLFLAEAWLHEWQTLMENEDGSEWEMVETLPEERSCLDNPEDPDSGSKFAYVFDDGSTVVIEEGTYGDAFDPLGWYENMDGAKSAHSR